MKTLNQNKGLVELANLRENFRNRIESDFEPAAKDCLTCDVKGSCCTDAHFVNVHISRLEAVAIGEAIAGLDQRLRMRVLTRNSESLAAMNRQSDSKTFEKSYSCPLFEKGIGCLVHQTAKPFPCINHACYENESDLPPSELLVAAEKKISRLNERVYRKNWNWLPIPEWIEKIVGQVTK